jgi:phosphatidylinositol glycan class T
VKKVYNSHYHSLGLDYYPECSDADCTEVFVSLELSLLSVTEPSNPQKWSFSDLFGKRQAKTCPLSEQSKVWIHQPGLKPSPSLSSTTLDSEWAVYQLRDFKEGLSVSVSREEPVARTAHRSPPVLWAHRYITGSGQEWGGLEVQLHSRYHQPLQVVYMDMIPWFLRLYTHTMKIVVTGENDTLQEVPNSILHQHYVPAKDREKSHMMELLVHLPPHSTTTLSVEFDRAFLRWNEHPPDAHHGFYVNSAVMTTILDECNNCTIPLDQMPPYVSVRTSHLLRVYAEPLLVQLPTPDFSMMFNVICFVSTVVAIAFGSLHNLTTKVLAPMESKKGNFFQRIFTFTRKVKSD